ncbi:MAG: hypothetical protein RIA69_00810 [Cyclobacteriaceae bacterium]
MEGKKRFTQLEEQMSNTLKAVDKLTADMQELREYTRENNKVVNSILHRLEENDERFEKVDKRFEKVDRRFEKIDKRFEKIDKRFERQDELLKSIVNEMSAERKLNEARFEFVITKLGSN